MRYFCINYMVCQMDNAATHPLWNDDYWLPVMQLFMRRPAGVKAMYAPATVELALSLHVPPEHIYGRMFALRRHDTPVTAALWRTYAGNPRRLRRDAATLRRMEGFGSSGAFYDGVTVAETWERDFRPVAGGERFYGDRPLMPVTLIMVLDMYFRLTPVTMTAITPEVRDMARLTAMNVDGILILLACFRHTDPYLNHPCPSLPPAVVDACRDVWRRYGNDDPQRLAALAAQMRDFFR